MIRSVTMLPIPGLLLLAAVAFSTSHAADGPPAPAAVLTAAAAVATPRTAEGRPDLSGYWATGTQGIAPGGIGGNAPPAAGGGDAILSAPLRNGDISNLTNDGVIARRASNDLPLYKPEHWDRVLDEDLNGNLRDPFNSCMPMGLPRMGPPARIIQTPTDVVFIYRVIFQRNDFRVIPIGPRRHKIDRDGSWLGDPVARWEGDTLVVETEGFNEQTWIGPEGYVHGYELKITERFLRTGNVLKYDVTVEDPEYLQQPWVLPTRMLTAIVDADYRIEESPPCSERDNEHLVGKNREM